MLNTLTPTGSVCLKGYRRLGPHLMRDRGLRPVGTAEDLIRVAEARRPVEDCFQAAKTEVELDHSPSARTDVVRHT